MNQPSVHLFGRHTSYNVQKVLWLLDELDISYEHTQIGGKFGGNDTKEFLAMNPLGKVPVLKHSDRIVWESNTIVRYLASEFSESDWISSEAYERALQERWMDWSIDRFESAFVGVFWGHYRTPPEQRDIVSITQAVNDCQSCLQLLDNELQGKSYLLGAKPCVADIATGVFLYRLINIDLDINIPANVMLWYERLSERPAFTKWAMSDFTELRGRAGY